MYRYIEKAIQFLREMWSNWFSSPQDEEPYTLDDYLVFIRDLKENPIRLSPDLEEAIEKEIANIPKDELLTLVKSEAIILSMTPGERFDWGIIDSSRADRIADGSGTHPRLVRKLLHNVDSMMNGKPPPYEPPTPPLLPSSLQHKPTKKITGEVLWLMNSQYEKYRG